MSQSESSALVLPADEPVREASLRRLLLFFDRLVLPDPCDRALLGDREIREEFPGPGVRTIEWSERVHFPRTPGYQEALESIRSNLGTVASRQLITFLPLRGPALPPPELRLSSYAAAISTPGLVRSAVPDLDLSVNPPVPESTFLFGFNINKTGYRSRYEVDYREPVELPESQQWTHLAWLRLARLLKYFDTARLHRHIPVALDAPNTSILLHLSSEAFVGRPAPSELASAAVAAEAVDAAALEAALESLSWAEVLAIRRTVLPRVAELRSLLLLISRRAGGSSDLVSYQRILGELATDLAKARSDLRNAWDSLRISTVIRTGAGMAGLTSLTLPTGLGAVLLAVVSGALIGTASVADKITGYYVAKRKVREHPLVFFDELPRQLPRIDDATQEITE